MELYIYNPKLELQGVLDDFFSLRWRRKYTTSGEFELHCNVTKDTLRLLQSGNLVAKRGSVECGVIEDITIADYQDVGETIQVKGRFLSSYLDRRITGAKEFIKDTAQNAMRKYINDNCINPTNADRVIPLLNLGELITDTEEIEVQATYKSVLETCGKLARKSAQGFRIRADFVSKQLYFEVYKGIDRSIEQSENERVILSDEYDNTKNTVYNHNNVEHKSFCVVVGTDENQTEVKEEVGEGIGLQRKESYVASSESKTAEISLIDYRKLLTQNGLDVLKKCEVVENFETEVDIHEDYKVKWNLGDIVSCIKKSWGRTLTSRITEVEEIYENGIVQIITVLGNPSKELIDFIKEDF